MFQYLLVPQTTNPKQPPSYPLMHAGLEVYHSGFGLWIKYATDVILLSIENRIYYIRIYSAAECG